MSVYPLFCVSSTTDSIIGNTQNRSPCFSPIFCISQAASKLLLKIAPILLQNTLTPVNVAISIMTRGLYFLANDNPSISKSLPSASVLNTSTDLPL